MTKKENTGKRLEKIVRLIHETLKDKPDTVIYSNHRVPNISGQKREFDLFIESSINGTTIKIAIECKAFKTPIPVEKIEAFNSKCDRISEIHKKLFVSQSGYQKDAINAAKDFGIELYNVENLTPNLILDWFPSIHGLGLRFAIREPKFVIDTSEEELSNLKPENYTHIYFGSNNEKKDTQLLLDEKVSEVRGEVWAIAINSFIKNGGGKSLGKKTTINFQAKFPNAYITSNAGVKYSVAGIIGLLDIWLVDSPPQIKLRQKFNTGTQTKASLMTVDLGSDEQADIIATEGKLKMFYTDKEGNTNELKLLARYDPKTKTLSKGE